VKYLILFVLLSPFFLLGYLTGHIYRSLMTGFISGFISIETKARKELISKIEGELGQSIEELEANYSGDENEF